MAQQDREATVVNVDEYSFEIAPSAREKLLEEREFPPGFLLCLVFTLSYQSLDRDQRIVEEYNGEHFSICGDEPNRRKNAKSFELEGMTISVMPSTLSKLNGKTLVYKLVPVGYPDPQSKQSEMLLAE